VVIIENEMNVPAAVFKAECLKLMDDVARTGKPIIITKHGKPVAQLVPMSPQAESLFGYMKHTVVTTGDIVAPTDSSWSVINGDEDHLVAISSGKSRAKRGRSRK
jgi:prevent-host-death family protein